MARRLGKIFILLSFLLPFSASAVTLNSSSYQDGTTIQIQSVSNTTNRLTIYNLDNSSRYCQTYKDEVDSIGGVKLTCEGPDYDFDAGHYSIIENSDTGLVCNRLSYDQCKALPSFINEFLFTIGLAAPSPSPSPSSGGGSGGASTAVISYEPQVQIITPLQHQVSSSSVLISYKATDKNDQDPPPIAAKLGIADNPVSLYYSKDSDIRRKVLIAKGLPASGSYLWDSTGLPDLNTYYIVADVFDKVGETGESQVGEFTIDHSVPFFTVTSNPSITKGEDVEIDVSSSKDLVTPPTLEVTQNNFVPTPVELTGTGKSFKGVYKVVSGYDGQASISVSGTDALGNMSSKILSGGSFQVGELTLKKPIVDSPKNNATVRTDQISVTGRGESGTQVVVSVNGGKQYKVSTDNSGNFVFNNISLDKNSNAGHNFLTLFAANNGGDASPAVSLEITVASPAATSSAPASPAAPEGESVPAQGLPPISPEPAVAPEALPAQTSATSTLEPASPVASPLSVDLLYPREGRGVSGVAEIDWQPDEAHLGKIKSATLSYRRGSGPYQIIVDNITYQKVLWDVSSLKEGGDYELKLDATDGVSKVEVKRKIIVDNTAPTINVTMVSKAASTTPYTLQASGTATDNLSGVDFIEYSLDGDHWFKADISGANLKDKVQFSLKYPFKLDDGDYIVRYRAVDGAGNNSKIYLSDIKLDQHAPRIGSYVISKGSIILLPDGDKKFELQADDTLNFKISLETDTASSSLTVAGIEYPMTRGDDGLWRTDFNIQNLGDYDLLISAADQGGKSFEERKIGEVGVKPNGVVAPGAQITAYVLDEAEKSYVRWQGEEFGIANPLTAGADGQYSLLLPAGKYYLKIQKDGFEKLRTNAFELTTPSYINFNFGLTRLAGLNAIIEPIIDKLMFYEN